MDKPDLKSLMYTLLGLMEEVNHLASILHNDQEGVFGKLSLPMPKFIPAELGFARTISWLFATYHEVGKINVEFLSGRLSAYNLDPDGKFCEYLRMVHQLRTFFQHNLDLSKAHNRDIQQSCGRWLRDQCRTSIPENEEQWTGCLAGLLNDSLNFLKAIQSCLRRIEQDESREQILREWDFRRKRYHPPHEFDNLISIVAADMGRENLDAVRLRKRFYDKWTKELELLQGNYDFKVVARKLIEHVLLVETTPVLPITGDDIMKEFNVLPGSQVGTLLRQARNFYDTEPCSRDTLFEKLRQSVGSDKTIE